METIKIQLPYEGIDPVDLKSKLESIEGCSVDSEAQSNLDAQVSYQIICTSVQTLCSVIALVATLYPDLLNRRVNVLNGDDEITMTNVKFKNLKDKVEGK